MDYFLSVFVGTFILEDVALALALSFIADGLMSWESAFLSCFLGIGLGDMGLYFLGCLIGKFNLENRFSFLKKYKKNDLLTFSVILCRFIPGTRTATYLIAGLFKYSLLKFTFITIVTVFAWVTIAFTIGHSLSSILMKHWFTGLALVLFCLHTVKSLIPKLSDPWERRAFFSSFKKWRYFEFWPAYLFYLPVVPYYIYLAVKHRDPFTPFYVNPEIENGGLVGESKWDFLKHLDPKASYTLKTLKLGQQNDFHQAKEFLEKKGFEYPFILKPDVGQRGFGVRIIRDDYDLTEYLLLADFEMIAQKWSLFSNEAGVFYIRFPHEEEGRIFSITDKKFPSVRGNGKNRLGDLILQDQRACLIASTYFARHRNRLNEVLEKNEVITLTECGNHAQGAIFLNGIEFNSEPLRKAIHKVATDIPHLYFARFDLRYKDKQSFMNGVGFEIVEVNGAGAEATHIWDAKTPLLEAYKTLFTQWSLLFQIGAEVKKRNLKVRISIRRFFKEILRMTFKKEKLSVSS